MLTVTEAREALDREVRFYLTDSGELNLWKFIDAYKAAGALEAHVEVCEERSVSWCRKHAAFRDTDEMRWHDDRCVSPDCRNSRECDFVGGYLKCGDGWHCDKANALRAEIEGGR